MYLSSELQLVLVDSRPHEAQTGIHPRRNRCRDVRRAGARDEELEPLAKDVTKRFHDTVKRQKKGHWSEYLQSTDNIRKAAKYLQPDGSGGFHRIAGLTVENRMMEDD